MKLKSILRPQKSRNILKNKVVSKVFDVFNRLPLIKQNKATTIYDNTLFKELLEACLNSGTARICIERRASYIFGNGFIDESVANKMANAKQTFNKLLATESQNVSLYKTVCLRVFVDGDGVPTHVYSLQVDKVKRGDGMFIYNPTLNTPQFDRTKDVEINEFDPSLTNAQRKEKLKTEYKNHGKQIGTILYLFNASIGQTVYCVPPAYSGIEDILSDHELSSYDLENLENGFLPSAIMTIIGETDDSIKDENGLTEKEKLQAKLKEFTAKKQGRARLLVMSSGTKEGVPNLQQMDTGKILDGLEKITDRIGRKVCRLFEIPPVLAGFEDASILGSNQTFKNALTILQHSVEKDQNLIEEALKLLFPDMNFEIDKLTLIDYIPNEILAELTVDELRALGGYEPKQSLIENESLTFVKKLSELPENVQQKILDLMSEEQLLNLVGMKKITELPPQASITQ